MSLWWFEHLLMNYFPMRKQKKIIIWHSKHIKNLQRVTHVQSAIVQSCKNTLLVRKTKESSIKFFAPFYKQNLFWFVFNLWSLQQTALNKPWHYPLKRELLMYCSHHSFFNLLTPLFKIKLSFNEQHRDCIVLIY